jgi:hypothetical protein
MALTANNAQTRMASRDLSAIIAILRIDGCGDRWSGHPKLALLFEIDLLPR